MKNIYLDIETIPTDDVAVKRHLHENLKAPGNMSKPETIQKWLDDPANFKKAVDKTSLSGMFGSIACIGIADDTSDVTILSGNESEKDILIHLLSAIRVMKDGVREEQHKLIGHNIAKFDAPFISQRMMVHDLGPLFPFGSKPWDEGMDDTMTMFAAGNRDYLKLVDLCMALNVDKPLDEIDGSQVAGAWRAGEHQKIFDHCRSDVIATRACYQRMMQLPMEQKAEVA